MLKRAPEQKGLIVDYFPVEKILKSSYNQLIAYIDNKNNSIKNIISYVGKIKALRFLTDGYDFCTKLDGAYQDFHGYKWYVNKISPDLTRLNEDTKETLRVKNVLRSIFKTSLLACRLDNAYYECEENDSILAFSHRRHGWTDTPFVLDNTFSIEFRTNFGYGRSSYFCTVLKYKDIEIIPYSLWVKYFNARMFEIIRCSADHKVKNSSWKKAMNYTCEAYNLLVSDEKEFIKKYLVGEAEEMVRGLEDILHDREYEFIDFHEIKRRTPSDRSDLVAFKGEKITGAIEFIEKITAVGNVADVSVIIERIKQCNIKMFGLLEKEKVLLLSEIVEYQRLLLEFQEQFNIIKPKMDYYRLLLNVFCEFCRYSPEVIRVDVLPGIGKIENFTRMYEEYCSNHDIKIPIQALCLPENTEFMEKMLERFRLLFGYKEYFPLIFNAVATELYQKFTDFYNMYTPLQININSATETEVDSFLRGLFQNIGEKAYISGVTLSLDEITKRIVALRKPYLGDFNFYAQSEAEIHKIINTFRSDSSTESVELIDMINALPIEFWDDLMTYLQKTRSIEQIDESMLMDYNEYVQFMNKCAESAKLLEETDAKLDHLLKLQSKIDKYIERIKSYYELVEEEKHESL